MESMEDYRNELYAANQNIRRAFSENRGTFYKELLKLGIKAGVIVVLYKMFKRSIANARKDERMKTKEEYKAKLERKCKEYEEVKSKIKAQLRKEKKKK